MLEMTYQFYIGDSLSFLLYHLKWPKFLMPYLSIFYFMSANLQEILHLLKPEPKFNHSYGPGSLFSVSCFCVKKCHSYANDKISFCNSSKYPAARESLLPYQLNISPSTNKMGIPGNSASISSRCFSLNG